MPGGGALFGNSSTRSASKNLVEFKAGKMTMKGKMVHPDLRKGLLFVYQSDDSLMHFCWKDRQSGTVEDDLIIFPDDCEFKRVSQCTTGRVYVLKFKSSSRKFFFWVQEARTDKDDDNCRRINEVLNNPPTPGSQRSAGGTPDGDLHNLLTNMSQQQLMQLFGGVGQIGGLSSILGTMNRSSTGSSRSASTPPTNASLTTSGSTTTPANTAAANADHAYAEATSTTTNSSNKSTNSRPTTTTSGGSGSTTTTTTNPPTIQLSDLQNFLSGLNVPVGETTRNVDLSAALTTENLESLLGDASLVRELQRHLPNFDNPLDTPPPASEQLRATLSSSQFQQALTMFSAALQSGQLGPVVQQFKVGQDAVNAAQEGNMEEFVKALQKTSIDPKDSEKSGNKTSTDSSKKGDSANSKKDDEDDEGMSVD